MFNIFGRPFVKRPNICNRPIYAIRPFSVLSVLYVCPVCDVNVMWQTVGWIMMKFGMQLSLGPGHIELDGDPAPLPKGADPQFSAHIYCCQMAASIKMPLGMEIGFAPGDFVLDGYPATPPQKRGGAPNFRLMSIVAKRLDGSRWYLARRWALGQATLC